MRIFTALLMGYKASSIIREFYNYPNILTNALAQDLINYKIYGNSSQNFITIDGTQYKIPTGYSLLDYAVSDGTAYVNTGYIVNYTDLTLKYKYRKITTLASNPLGYDGYYGAGSTVRLLHSNIYNSNAYYGNSSVVTTVPQALDTDYEVEFEISNSLGYGKWTVNGTEYSDSSKGLNGWTDTNTATQTYPDFLFGTNDSSGSTYYLMKGRLYYAKYYKNNTDLERAFYFLKKDSDNSVVCYDFITGTFPTITGTLTAGNEAPCPTQPLDVVSVGDKTANLLDKDNANILASGYIPNTSSGTIVSSSSARTIYIPCEKSTTYSLYFGTAYTKRIASSSVIPALGTAVSNIMTNFTDNTISYTTDSTANYLVVQLFIDSDMNAGATIDIAKETLVIVKGSTAPSSYIPYGYQIPIVSSGLNLFNKDDITTGYRLSPYLGYAYATKGITTTVDFYTDNAYYCSHLIPVEVGETFIKNSPTADAYHRYKTYNADKISVRKVETNSITIQDGEAYIAICGRQTELNTTMVVKGSTIPTSYVAYVTPVTTDIYLDNPLRGISTYKDYTSYENQNVVRNIGVKIFDGTENWSMDFGTGMFHYQLPSMSILQAGGLCNVFKYNPVQSGMYSSLADGEFGIQINTGNTKLFIKCLQYSTVSDWTTYLATQYANGTPVILAYPLATPTTETATIPALTMTAGDNTITTGTTIAPADFYSKAYCSQ